MELPTIFTVGSSHLIALMGAYSNRAKLREPIKFEFLWMGENDRYKPFLELSKGEWLLNRQLQTDLVERLTALRPNAVLVSGWSNQHFIHGTLNHPRPFDFFMDREERDELVDGAEVVPLDLVRNRMKEACRWGILLTSYIKSISGAPIYFLSAPPIVEDLTAIPEGISLKDFDQRKKTTGMCPPSFRLKVWRLFEDIFKQVCHELGIYFVSPPPDSFDSRGFLRQEYWGNDWLHANRQYGDLVLCQVEKLLLTQYHHSSPITSS